MNDVVKMLKVVEQVRYLPKGWPLTIFQQHIYDGNISVVEKKWEDEWFQREYADRLNIETPPSPETKFHGRESHWQTHRGCVMYIINSDGTVHVTLWDGDNWDGRRLGIRWTATFKAPLELLAEIFENQIKKSFKNQCVYLYEKEQQKLMEDALQAIAERKLSEVKDD